jgi:ABC-type antimicrobial peptide transport system ATPase subunit
VVSADDEAEPEAVPVDEPVAAEPVAEAPLLSLWVTTITEVELVLPEAMVKSVQTWTSDTAPAYCGQAEMASYNSELLSEYHESTASV